MTDFEVIFYEKENGDCPVEEFINSLDVKMRAKMVGLLELLEEKGNDLREPYSKPMMMEYLRFGARLEII